MKQNEHVGDSSFSRFLEIIIYLLFFLGPLTGNVIMVLFHVLSVDFNVSHNAILISIPAFMFPFAITQLFAGAISDIKGRIPVLIVGLILFALAMLMAAISINLEIYTIANVLAGVGFGLINPVLIALMSDLTPPPNIPNKMGYMGAMANLGVGIGPLIASQMITFSWRSIYILFLVLTCFCLIYMFFIKRPPQKISKETGIKILVSQLSKEWRRLVVILLMVSAFLYSHTYLAITIWTSRSLAGVVDESITGIILGLAGVGGAIAGALTGYLIRRKGVNLPFVIGLISSFISLAILLIIGDITRTEVFMILAIGWIIGALAGGILFTSMAYYSQVLSPERRGALAGSFTASYFVGIALVPTTLAPFSDTWGISGVYIAILVITIIFMMILMVLAKLANSIISEEEN